MAETLSYNAMMALVDVALLCQLRIRRNALAPVLLAGGAALVGFLLAILLGGISFDAVRLTAWAVFAHGPVLGLGFAVILWRGRRCSAIVSALLAATLVLVAADAFLVEPEWLDVSHVEIVSPKLRRPYRLVVLADLQTDRIGDYERRVLREVVQAEPDVVLLAGDYLQVQPEQWEPSRAALNAAIREANLPPRARIFAVRGNVDGPDWAYIFRGLDVATISTTQSFDLGEGLRLTCLSLEASHSAALPLAADQERFHVVLGHIPNFALSNVPAELLIAGHTHGGQVRFPLIGAVTTLSRIPRRWPSGLTDLPGGGRLSVSRGIGMERGGAPRLRFLCRPELVVIDLTPSTR